MSYTINIYSANQLLDIQNQINAVYLNLAKSVLNKYIYGIDKTLLEDFYKLWLYKRVIDNWNQWQDGNVENPTAIYNSVSEDEFTDIVVAALNICC